MRRRITNGKVKRDVNNWDFGYCSLARATRKTELTFWRKWKWHQQQQQQMRNEIGYRGPTKSKCDLNVATKWLQHTIHFTVFKRMTVVIILCLFSLKGVLNCAYSRWPNTYTKAATSKADRIAVHIRCVCHIFNGFCIKLTFDTFTANETICDEWTCGQFYWRYKFYVVLAWPSGLNWYNLFKLYCILAQEI